MKIYLSGPISGYDLEERKQAFENARKEILDFCERWDEKSGGHTEVEVFSPIHAYKEGMTYAQIMRYDIEQLLTCDMICFMKGWRESKGCNVEEQVARACGIKVFLDNL